MPGEIIRMGEKTSRGGTVLEGSQTDICMGKPIAFIGLGFARLQQNRARQWSTHACELGANQPR
jgi:uncharacterized Zn-binding protein involved in type VI secretion